jgi:hypothetical protein
MRSGLILNKPIDSNALSNRSKSLDIPDTNLALWIDANDNTTITKTGSLVSQINDKSGLGNHMYQGTSAYQPTLNVNTINGKQAITFSGAQYLLGNNNPAFNTDRFTFFIVMKNGTTLTNGREIFATKFDDNTSSYWSVSQYVDTNLNYKVMGKSANNTSVSQDVDFKNIASPHILSVSLDSSNIAQLKINGNDRGLITGWNDVPGTHQYNLLGAGYTGGSVGLYSKTNIGEVLYYVADLNDDKYKLVLRYLKEKWRIK